MTTMKPKCFMTSQQYVLHYDITETCILFMALPHKWREVLWQFREIWEMLNNLVKNTVCSSEEDLICNNSHGLKNKIFYSSSKIYWLKTAKPSNHNVWMKHDEERIFTINKTETKIRVFILMKSEEQKTWCPWRFQLKGETKSFSEKLP